jgi:nitrogen-specific signal transduction histidine kinase
MKKPHTIHSNSAATLPVMTESMAVLARGMADNFNNILTTVLGACSLIDMDDPANSELLRYVALIRASAERAAVLSERLLCASVLEQKKLHPDGHLQAGVSADASERDKTAIHDIVHTKYPTDGASS